MPKDPEGDTSTREQKHMAIIYGIDRLRIVRGHLGYLCNEIVGSPPAPEKVPEETEPALVTVLNNAGDEITSIANEMNDMINEIRGLIF